MVIKMGDLCWHTSITKVSLWSTAKLALKSLRWDCVKALERFLEDLEMGEKATMDEEDSDN